MIGLKFRFLLRRNRKKGVFLALIWRRRLTLVCGPGMKALPCYPNMMPSFDVPGNEAAISARPAG